MGTLIGIALALFFVLAVTGLPLVEAPPEMSAEERAKKEHLLNQLRSLKTGDLLITNKGKTWCVVSPPKARGKSEWVVLKESNWRENWTTDLENLTTMVSRVVPTTDLYWPVAARNSLISS